MQDRKDEIPENHEGDSYFEVEDPTLFNFNLLVRHTRNVISEIQDITLLVASEDSRSGLVVGYIQDGVNRITIPVGAIGPDGNAWTMLSAVPMYAMGDREDTKGVIPTRVLQTINPQE